jgi:Pyridoxamine 5'-phosphate oxidase
MEMKELLIPEAECWELLAGVSLGRVALSLHALPVILPVQYYLDGHTLAVCLGHREIPEQSLDTIVAFAADAIDPVARSGWTVQIQGRSTIPRQLGVALSCGWPPAGQVVCIKPGTVTGYWIRLCPFVDSLLARPDDS